MTDTDKRPFAKGQPVKVVSVGQEWMLPLVGFEGKLEKKRENESGPAYLVGGLPCGPYWLREKDLVKVEEEEGAA